MVSYTEAELVPRKTSDSNKFYNHTEAKIIAETYYKMGCDLYCSVLELLKTPNPKTEDACKLWPAFVNLAFSCEIILKLFYENDHGKTTTGHKLYTELYTNLSDDSKQLISNLTIQNMIANGDSHYTIDNFNEDLKKSENTFAYERYSFEIVAGRGYSLQCDFLFKFSQTLNILSKQLV